MDKTKLLVNQSDRDNSFQYEVRYMEQLRLRDSLDLLNQSDKIVYLEDKVSKLRKLEEDVIPFDELCIEAKINYDKIKTLGYARTFVSNFTTVDTLMVFTATWDESISEKDKDNEQRKLYKWIKYKLKHDTLVVN